MTAPLAEIGCRSGSSPDWSLHDVLRDGHRDRPTGRRDVVVPAAYDRRHHERVVGTSLARDPHGSMISSRPYVRQEAGEAPAESGGFVVMENR